MGICMFTRLYTHIYTKILKSGTSQEQINRPMWDVLKFANWHPASHSNTIKYFSICW